jgi:hypothetical protein
MKAQKGMFAQSTEKNSLLEKTDFAARCMNPSPSHKQFFTLQIARANAP